MLEHRVPDLVDKLRRLAAHQDVVLLDYTTNADPADLSSPLSHAALIADHLTDPRPSTTER